MALKVENQKVVALRVENEQPTDWFGYEKTNLDGVYMIDRVSSGDYWVFCYPPEGSNYALDLTPKKIKVGPTTWKLIDNQPYVEADFELEIGGSISGTVYEADGVAPAKDIIVGVSSQRGVGDIDVTDINGNYRIKNILPTENCIIGIIPIGNVGELREGIPIVKGI